LADAAAAAERSSCVTVGHELLAYDAPPEEKVLNRNFRVVVFPEPGSPMKQVGLSLGRAF